MTEDKRGRTTLSVARSDEQVICENIMKTQAKE